MSEESFATRVGTTFLAIVCFGANVLVFFYVGIPFGNWATSWIAADTIRTFTWLWAICVPTFVLYPITEKLFAKWTKTDQLPNKRDQIER